MICSFPRTANSTVFPELFNKDEIELELVHERFDLDAHCVKTSLGHQIHG